MRGPHALTLVLLVPIALCAAGCEQHALREEISLLRQENERLRDHIAEQDANVATRGTTGSGGGGMSDISMGSDTASADTGGSEVLANPETTAAPVADPSSARPVKYVVRSGDSLSRIARNIYGDSSKWLVIYNANRRVIGPNYDKLEVGMELEMPVVRN